MINKAEIIVYGRVQKAGYKDFIDEIAFNLNIDGKVENLDNGTVQIICEGKENDIKELIKKIDIKQYPIRVEKIDVVSMIPIEEINKEFTSFEIVREKDLTLATYERMDSAARYIREMNSNLGGKIDSLKTETTENFGKIGNKMDTIIEKQEEMIGEIRGLRNDFQSYFDQRFEKLEKDVFLIKEKMHMFQ